MIQIYRCIVESLFDSMYFYKILITMPVKYCAQTKFPLILQYLLISKQYPYFEGAAIIIF